MKMKREAKKENGDKIYFETASNIDHKMTNKKEGNWLVFFILKECAEEHQLIQ